MALKLLFEKYKNYNLLESYNGEEALMQLKNKSKEQNMPFLIFTDINMPIMNGY